MRSLFPDFKINGKPILAPDADIQIEYNDLDSADAGRDETGFLHRSVVRSKVRKWTFTYSFITPADYAYMRSIIDAEDGTFLFTCPQKTDPKQSENCTAYISKFDLVWKSASTGNYRNFKFSVIEC